MRKLLRAGLIVLALLCLNLPKTFAQDNVGIGTTNPRPTALLDLFSNDKGLLIPRVDTLSLSLSGLDHGMVVYDTTNNDMYVWDGTKFVSLTQGAGATSVWTQVVGDIHYTGGNAAIGTSTINPNAILTLAGDGSQGVQIPRVDTTTMTLGAGDIGMLVYDSTIGDFYIWEGSSFTSVTQGGGSLWTLNGADVYYTAGNVGIGTTSPGSPLTINTSGANEIEFVGATDANINAPFLLALTGGNITLQSSINTISAGSNRLQVDIAGIAIGTSTVSNSNASLTLTGNDKGLALNKVDTNSFSGLGGADRGLIVYDTVVGEMFVWDGTKFTQVGSTGAIDTLPANVFSACFDGSAGVGVSEISSSHNFVQSVTRTAIGTFRIDLAPGFFTQNPAVSVTPLLGGDITGAAQYSTPDQIFATTQAGGSPQDRDFCVILQRQGADYQNTLTAPPNVVGLWQSNGTQVYVDTANVLIGSSTAPFASTELQIIDEDNPAVISANVFSNTAQDNGRLFLGHSRGTQAVPLATQNNDWLGTLYFSGHTGSNFVSGAQIYGNASEIWSTGNTGTFLGFTTTPNGTSSAIERMRISASGNVGIGTPTPGEKLHVSDDVNGGFVSIVAENTNVNGIASFDLVSDNKRFEFRLEGSGAAEDFWMWDSKADEARMIIDDAGQVGIGDWGPQTQFDVTDSVPGGFTSIEIENLDPTGAAALNLWNDNTAYALGIDGSSAGNGLDDKLWLFNNTKGEFSFVLDTAGNIGIGNVTSPLVQLHVDGDGLFNGFIGLQDLGSAPGVTNNRLYNVGGDLFWDGNQLLSAADTAIWSSDGTNIWNKNLGIGGVGIGTNAPAGTYEMEIENNTRNNSLYIDNRYTGASNKWGILLDVSDQGSGSKTGIRNRVFGTTGSGSTIYGIYNQMQPNGTGTAYGSFVQMTNQGTGIRYGYFSNVFLGASNTNVGYGMRSDLDQDGTNSVYGLYSSLTGSGTGSSYGAFLTTSKAGTSNYGVYTVGEDYNYFSGNVGIGNTTPSVRLHVDGDGLFNGFLGLQDLGSAPGVTNNRMYNVGGDLFWDGNQLLTNADTAIWATDGVDIWSKPVTGGIGINTSALNANYSTTLQNNGRLGGLRIENIYNGASAKYGLFTNISNAGTGDKYGNYVNLLGTSASGSALYGTYNFMSPSGATGSAYGNYNNVLGSGTGVRYGVYNDVDGAGSNSSAIYGIRNVVQHNGSGIGYGSFSIVSGSSNSNMYGDYSQITSSGSGNHFGQFVNMAGSGTAVQYGLYVSHSAVGSGLEYGVYTTGEDRNYFSGDVGIGATIPSQKLHVEGGNIFLGRGDGSDLLIHFSGDNNGISWSMGVEDANNADFIISNNSNFSTPRLFIGGSGGSYDNSIGMGTVTPQGNYRATISTDKLGGLYIDNTFTGGSVQYGVNSQLANAGTGTKYGYYTNVDGAGTGAAYGYRGVIDNSGSGIAYGGLVTMANTGTGSRFGYVSSINVGGTNTNQIYGFRSDIDQDGSGAAYGVFSRLDGSGTTTSYAFYGDQQNAGTGDYGVYTTGEERNYFSGDVGVGTATPNRELHVHSTSTSATIQMTNANTGTTTSDGMELNINSFSNLSLLNREAANLYLGTSGANRVTIDAAGLVGIGTTNPNYMLQVNGTTTNTSIQLTHPTSGTSSTDGLIIGLNSSNQANILLRETANMFLGTAAVTRMTLESGGDVGIGVTTPSTLFHIQRASTLTTPLFYVQNTSTGDASMSFIAPGNTWSIGLDNSDGDAFKISDGTQVGSGVYINVETSGNIGLGTTTPQNKLDVEGGMVVGASYSGSSTAPSNGILSQGPLLIGATSGGGYGVEVHQGTGYIVSIEKEHVSNTAYVRFMRQGAFVGSITESGGTTSYNAFTGSHIASLDKDYDPGTLISISGELEKMNEMDLSEPIYKGFVSNKANDPSVLGSFLHAQEDSAADPYNKLIMAVGNGFIWVVDNGDDLEVGDYLISSDVEGHAMLDNGDFEVAYIVARVAEPVNWYEETATIDGVKHKRISVFFEHFTRNHKAEKLELKMAQMQEKIDEISAKNVDFENELKEIQLQLKSVLGTKDLEVKNNSGLND